MRLSFPLVAGLLPAAIHALTPSSNDLLARQNDATTNNGLNQAPGNDSVSLAPVSQASFQETLVHGNVSFAVTLNNATGVMRFRMGGPARYGWIAFGVGNRMKDNPMFVLYRQDNKDGVTLSARSTGSHFEPQRNDRINLTVTAGPDGDFPDRYDKETGMMYATGICGRCIDFGSERLSTANQNQNFMYAIGPVGLSPMSSDPNAPLRKHIYHGTFQLNMRQTNSSGIPSLSYIDPATAQSQDPYRDRDYAESAHAFFMLLTVVLVIPVAVFFVRVLERVKVHMYLQTCALVFVLAGFIAGCIISKQYQRSVNFRDPHQIIGIIFVILLLAQWVLGFLSHRTYLRTQQPLKWAMTPHRAILGPLLFAAMILNASLGFRLAQARQLTWIFLPFILAVVIALTAATFAKRWFFTRWGNKAAGGGLQNRQQQQQSDVQYGQPGGGPAASGQWGGATSRDAFDREATPSPHPYGAGGGVYNNSNRSDIALGDLGDPPPYQAQPTKPREFA